MGSTDRIAPHVFQDAYLPADGSIVDGSPQRAEVVMVADALEDGPLAIQEEAFVRS